jgi:hypothetical protein
MVEEWKLQRVLAFSLYPSASSFLLMQPVELDRRTTYLLSG